MARRDIWPYASEHSGHDRLLHARMGALTTDSGAYTSWLEGEIVVVNAAVGDLDYALAGAGGAVDPVGGLHGIAAASSQNLIAMHGEASGAATHDIMVPYFDFYHGQEFVTGNVYNGGDAELDLDGGAVLVGVTADLWVDDAVAAHNHGLDIAGNYFTIIRRLDALGRDSDISGDTTTSVVFRRNV